MKNLHLYDGQVLGLKVKIVPDVNNSTKEHTVAICLSIQFLYTQNDEIGNSADLEIEVFGIKDKLAIGKRDGVLSIGEHCDLKVILMDYRDYLQNCSPKFLAPKL